MGFKEASLCRTVFGKDMNRSQKMDKDGHAVDFDPALPENEPSASRCRIRGDDLPHGPSDTPSAMLGVSIPLFRELAHSPRQPTEDAKSVDSRSPRKPHQSLPPCR